MERNRQFHRSGVSGHSPKKEDHTLDDGQHIIRGKKLTVLMDGKKISLPCYVSTMNKTFATGRQQMERHMHFPVRNWWENSISSCTPSDSIMSNHCHDLII